MASADDIDLYELLNLTKGASKSEVKKAYHKAALTSHPDKVPEDEREEADIKFKAISQAYEILSDDDKRAAYDQYGMAAFEQGGAGGGFGQGPDLDDILAQMFGGGAGGMGGMPGMGGMGGMGGAGGGRRQGGKGKNEVQQYEVSLEELYKGKTTRFASTKKVVCEHCHGSGGKEKAKAKPCDSCKGRGQTTRIRPVGPGLVTQETVPCSTCSGRGSFFADKDKCKKCKGVRTVSAKKILELYIPRGSREGDKIVLAGEADQDPDDDSPGDIIFELVEEQHKTFHRAGADLQAELDISLSEALTGFNRIVLTHLDGRGIRLHIEQPDGRVLRPDQILKIRGEGMPIKRSDAKGDLFLTVNVEFPEDGWLKSQAAVDKVKAALPTVEPVSFGVGETPEIVDEVDFEEVENLEEFGAGSDDPRAGGDWEDDEEGAQGAQCAQQ
ncbi:DnaJ-like protein xdj1 [Recurvomyces mirabilis]|uniref:DnaJ-like protein xdj1 n=1 Tax=Recurvomyces mirabilis TaxID=574656 RepID=A0AAE0WXT7_9PEZI|nr:DnaJ-like protein xdj1 [Recurvomyces mirabilis]KAK5162010.1 DnaJ-like protein xdj1 [Recurvomyces mirabilis]